MFTAIFFFVAWFTRRLVRSRRGPTQSSAVQPSTSSEIAQNATRIPEFLETHT
jgi:flagellar biogenesis protein FliO